MFNRRFCKWVAIVLLLAPWVRVLLAVASAQPDESPTSFPAIPSFPAATDDHPRFLDALHQEGLHVGQNDQEATKLGRAICRQLDNGQSEQQQEQLAIDSGLNAQDAHKFVVISVLNYCPDHENQIFSPQTTAPQVPS